MDLADILIEFRGSIIDEWVRRLHTEVSVLYSAQKVEVLYGTVTSAYDANYSALIDDDFSKVDAVVENIGNMRSRAGFSLSEVQKAFELYRTVLTPIVVRESEQSQISERFAHIDCCLSYTIHKFSDYFQALSEKQIREYAQTLELKVAERTKQLAESEDKYRTLVEEMRDGYCVNESGKIIYANRAFCRMHGYKRREVIGRPFTDFVAPESLDEVVKIYEKREIGIETKEQYVYLRRHKDGRSLPTENRVNVVRYQGMTAALVTCCDITERLRIEERIRETEHLAHIGHLTASLAHEIRNPLSAATMSIQMLLKNPVFTGYDRRRLEILAYETSRLDRIVTQMLDFAKPIKFEFEPVSLVALIDSCLSAMETKIQEKSITVKRKFPGTPPVVMVDPEKMEQAIINLLLNAVEAVSHEGEITIAVRCQRGKSSSCRIEILDNGDGVRGDDLPFIFDPFFSKKAKGTGLGLANAKKMVEAHGGSIKAMPVNPHGLCMSITVPRDKRPKTVVKGRVLT